MKERAEKGIQDPQGKAASKMDNVDYYQLGTQTLSTLGQCDSRAILWNNEGVDYALKSHLFGYLFSRDNFSPINREIVTVGTLAGFETVQNQLRSHLNILKNLGLSKDELKRITAEITKQNPQAADKANKVVDKL